MARKAVPQGSAKRTEKTFTTWVAEYPAVGGRSRGLLFVKGRLCLALKDGRIKPITLKESVRWWVKEEEICHDHPNWDEAAWFIPARLKWLKMVDAAIH